MAAGKRVQIIRCLPRHDRLPRIIKEFGASGLVVMSSNNDVIASLRDSAERDECGLLAAYESQEFELRTLAEVVRMFGEAAGVALLPVAYSEQQAALAGRAAADLADDSYFGDCRELPGFHSALAATLQELRQEEISLSSDGSLTGKLQQVASLEEKFRLALEDASLTTLTGRIERVVEAKSAKPSGCKRILWVGECEWHRAWLRFAAWIANSGISLALAAERNHHRPGMFPGEAVLRSAFPEASVEDFDSEDGGPLVGLFAENKGGGAAGKVQIVETSDEFLETEWAVRTARTILETDGPRSVKIFSRDLRTYGPLLQAAARRIDVTLDIARKEPLSANAFARAFESALNLCADGPWQELLDLVRSSYGMVPGDQQQAVCKALATCRKADNRWTALQALSENESVPRWLGKLASWRIVAASRERTLADWIHGLSVLAPRLPFLEMCSERDTAAQDAMIRSLHTARLLFGAKETLSISDFARVCKETWNNVEFTSRAKGDIPVVTSPAAIGSAANVIAIGMTEGRFPGRRAEDPILLDRDRTALAASNPAWKLRTSYDKAEERERDFYRLCVSANTIFFSYPVTMEEHPEVPTSYLDDIRSAFPADERAISFDERFPLPNEGLQPNELLPALTWHRNTDFDPGDLALAMQRQLQESVLNAAEDKLRTTAARDALSSLPNPLRLADLRTLRRCPFQFIASAKLGLRGRRVNWIGRALRKTVLNADFFTPDFGRYLTSLTTAWSDELDRWSGEVRDEDIAMMEVVGTKALADFAKREFFARKTWSLVPLKVNATFDEAGMYDMLVCGDQTLNFSDRVDFVYSFGPSGRMVLRLDSRSDGFEQAREADTIFLLMKQGDPRASASDSPEPQTDGKRYAVVAAGLQMGLATAAPHLSASNSKEPPNDIRRAAHEDLKSVIALHGGGNVSAIPGEYCQRCDFGSLCRRPNYGTLSHRGWDELDEA
jgi:hypothetical protein